MLIQPLLAKMYGNSVHLVNPMDTVSVNQFRDNLKKYVERVADTHEPLKVSRRNGEGFVVISESDWAAEQETLYVLSNSSLMRQLSESMASHAAREGYRPTPEQMAEIMSDDE